MPRPTYDEMVAEILRNRMGWEQCLLHCKESEMKVQRLEEELSAAKQGPSEPANLNVTAVEETDNSETAMDVDADNVGLTKFVNGKKRTEADGTCTHLQEKGVCRYNGADKVVGGRTRVYLRLDLISDSLIA
jgi:hypothetical protein